MATVTLGYNAPNGFVSGETVTPAKLNSLGQPTISAIVNADIAASAAIALSKLAGGALPSAITVASANIVDGTITATDLATAVANALVPAGAVMPFAMNSAPSGWLAADGSAVSRSTYAALFSAIGTTYGSGDGSTTFNLPDLRGIFVRGSGSQAISGTTYSGTFAAKQQDALKTHTHIYTLHGIIANGYSNGNLINAGAGNQANTGAPSTGTSDETRPANIALLYCIKF